MPPTAAVAADGPKEHGIKISSNTVAVLPPKQNTPSASNLPVLIAIDTACALFAAAVLSPFVMTIDKGVTQAMSKPGSLKASLMESALMLRKTPRAFLRQPSLWAVYGVYTATYTAANTMSTLCEVGENNTAFSFWSEYSFWTKSCFTTAVNMVASIAKDRYFARIYGTKLPSGLPAMSYLLFFVRDFATIFAGFQLPQGVANVLQTLGLINSAPTAGAISQFLTPAAAQLVLTPIHLLALDIYNHPTRKPAERGAGIAAQYKPLVGSRMLRVLAAYGAGGLVNKGLRSNLRAQLA